MRKLTMTRLALIALELAAAIGVPAALANHVPGGLYRGTHSNGGAFELRLNASGNLQSFLASDLKLGGSCPASTGLSIPSGFPVVDHRIDLIGSSVSLSATFPTPTTARGTLELSCSSTKLTWTATLVGPGGTTTPAKPAAPATATAPGFRNGGFVGLERKAGVAYVRARFRACGGTPPLQLAVRQRRKVASGFVADSRFTLKLPAGTPATVPDGAICRDFSVAWRPAPKFFGGGTLVITLKLVDARGQASGIPGYLLRSPTK